MQSEKPRLQRDLPEKYYLDHFQEMLSYIEGTCQHLLNSEHRDFLNAFSQLEENTRCLLVRIINRKSALIKVAKLTYDEIGDNRPHLSQLSKHNLITTAAQAPLRELFTVITKPELLAVLKQNGLSPRSSCKKAELVDEALLKLSSEDICLGGLHGAYVYRTTDLVMDYFFYLYFGDFRSRLDKFSLRDMGVMRTRHESASKLARYDYKEHAISAFEYGKRLKTLPNCEPDELLETAQNFQRLPTAIGNKAEDYCARYLLALGQAVLHENTELALEIWSVSDNTTAQEKWCRHAYQMGLKEQVETRLNHIIADPASDALLLFAEDFLARKFKQKRTSVLTDVLRDATEVFQLDDIHRNDVERGVQQAMQRDGIEAYFTENQLFRALFGLVFWDLLFASGSDSVVNEFDFMPRVIYQNCFYDECEDEIEAILTSFDKADELTTYLNKMATKAYGQGNAMFRWRSNLLEVLGKLVAHARIEHLCAHLRAMSQDFKVYSDGYPDLMVIEGNTLRFAEVKSPGDQLRRNQLVILRQLQRCGFNVGITRVCWGVDPKQPYVVVDVETTGGRGSYHRITEIGMVKLINGTVVDRWQSLINPLRHIPANITRLTGISNEMVADAPLFSEVVEQVDQFLSGSIFVAHNVNFDYGFFKQEYSRLERDFNMPKLCTVAESRRTFPKLKSYSLANLCQHFDIDMTRHHRAMSDAEAAAEILCLIQAKRLENS